MFWVLLAVLPRHFSFSYRLYIYYLEANTNKNFEFDLEIEILKYSNGGTCSTPTHQKSIDFVQCQQCPGPWPAKARWKGAMIMIPSSILDAYQGATTGGQKGATVSEAHIGQHKTVGCTALNSVSLSSLSVCWSSAEISVIYYLLASTTSFQLLLPSFISFILVSWSPIVPDLHKLFVLSCYLCSAGSGVGITAAAVCSYLELKRRGAMSTCYGEMSPWILHLQLTNNSYLWYMCCCQ